MSSGRTGARPGRPAGTSAQPTAGERVRYRGIRWRKDPDGTIGWYNEEAGGWLRWRPGGDAPPVPPRWADDVAKIPVPPRLRRASWRSPYRLVPIALALGAVVLGVVQVDSSTSHAAARANREAHALLGHCLAPTGTAKGVYSTTPVPCGGPTATVRVVAVHRATGTRPVCPAGSTALRLSYVGVATPDIECVEALRHG